MNAIVLMVGVASLGVDYGWHTLEDGQLEYIIQIEPTLVPTLTSGMAITSEIPPELQNVRRFRIMIGNRQIPRSALPKRDVVAPEPADVVSPEPPPHEPEKAEPPPKKSDPADG